jgi:hypothetical protein
MSCIVPYTRGLRCSNTPTTHTLWGGQVLVKLEAVTQSGGCGHGGSSRIKVEPHIPGLMGRR